MCDSYGRFNSSLGKSTISYCGRNDGRDEFSAATAGLTQSTRKIDNGESKPSNIEAEVFRKEANQKAF